MPLLPTSPFVEAIRRERQRVTLPTSATTAEIRGWDKGIRDRSFFSAQTLLAEPLETYRKVLAEILEPREATRTLPDGTQAPYQAGLDPASARLKLKEVYDRIGYTPDEEKRGTIEDLSSDARIDLVLKTNEEIAHGFGQWRQQQETIDAFPAWELYRQEDRNKPRDWSKRFLLAGQLSGRPIGDGWTITPDGAMIALLNHPLWEQLGSSANWDDALDRAEPPFAFNSGMWTRAVGRRQAIEIGILDLGEKVAPEERDFDLPEKLKEPRAEITPAPAPVPTIDPEEAARRAEAERQEQLRQREAQLAEELQTVEKAVKAAEKAEKALEKAKAGEQKIRLQFQRLPESEMATQGEVLAAAWEKSVKKISEANASADLERNLAMQKLTKSIKAEKPSSVELGELPQGAGLKPERYAQAEKWFKETVGAQWLDGKQIGVLATTDDRCHAQGGNIYMNRAAGPEVVVHEMGHCLEENHPALTKEMRQYVNDRYMQGRREVYEKHHANPKLSYEEAERTYREEVNRDYEIRPLREITMNTRYMPWEKGFGDKWIDAYASKQYDDGQNEVTSMALQWLYENPLYFYQKDRDLFTFFLRVLRGLPGKKAV